MTQLVTQPIQLPATAELYRQATDVAGVCKEIVLKTAMEIQGRSYVKVEGWQSIATAHGCTASARDVDVIPGEGVRAIGEIRRMSDGIVIATAEGFVGEDEPTWFGGEVRGKTLPKRPLYAIRAMAQTRAISRACRTAFAHVVVLMNANLSTTPAEEVPAEGFQDAHNSTQERSKPAKDTKPTPDLSDAPKAVAVPANWQDCEIHFGKNKGKKLGDLDQRSLSWYVSEWQPKPYKGRIADADSVLREMLDKAGDEMTEAAAKKQAEYAQAANQAAQRRGEAQPVPVGADDDDNIPF